MANPITLILLAESDSGRLKIPKAQQETKGAKTGRQGSL